MCKRTADPMDMTEECFQQMPLNFVGETHTIHYLTPGTPDIEIPAMTLSEGTNPPGSQWRRNPIPCCVWLSGGPSQDCPFPSRGQFDPPVNVKTGKSTGIQGYGPFKDWRLEDKIQVPN